jgi:hypothetical protein
MPRLIGENLSSTKLGDYGTRSSIIQVRRGEKDTGMTAPAGLTQVQGQENRFIRLMRTYLLIDLSFLNGYKISMRNDHLYQDPEYSWDEYIQAQRFENSWRAGEGCLKSAESAPRNR